MIALVIALKDLRLLSRDPGAIFWALVFPLSFAVLFGAVFPSAQTRPDLEVGMSGDLSRIDALRRNGLSVTPRSKADGLANVRSGNALAEIDVTPAGVEITTDPMHAAEGGAIDAATTRAFASGLSGMPSVHRVSASPSSSPSGFAIAFPAAILWGLIGCAGAFATASIAERRAGTHARLCAAPVSAATLLGGKLIACLIACVVDSALLLVIARVAFGVPFEQFSFYGLPFVILCCAICFAGITVFLGVLGKSEQSVGGAGWAVLLLFAMIGGAMVPLSTMPHWLREASSVSPVKWGIVALEGATFRGLSFRELMPACGVLLAIGFASVAAAAARIARTTP
ncbi:MAG: ABC transporter permease [Polyangiaceae bacterium]